MQNVDYELWPLVKNLYLYFITYREKRFWRGKIIRTNGLLNKTLEVGKEKVHNVAHWCRSMFHIIWKLMILAKYCIFWHAKVKKEKHRWRICQSKAKTLLRSQKRRQVGLGILFAYFSSYIYLFIFLKECLKLSIAITSISATVEKYLKEASPVSKNTADFVSLPNPIPSSSDAGKNEWFFYSVLKLA